LTALANRAPATPDPGNERSREEDDARLAAALLAGDSQAAAAAWHRFAPLVNTILRRHAAATADRQDLRQEVFLRFFARIGELRNPRALRTFLINICLGVAQNEHRRTKVRLRLQLTSNGELPEITVDPADLEAREATRRLCRAIADLGAGDRSLFLVRHVDKLELGQIARVIGRPLSTTKRYLARANRRIAGRMRRDPVLMEYADRLFAPRAVAA
jgi:RNA polymerase sigma-70 factor (ECF subfamily)